MVAERAQEKIARGLPNDLVFIYCRKYLFYSRLRLLEYTYDGSDDISL